MAPQGGTSLVARPTLDRNVKFKALVRRVGLPRPFVLGLLELLWQGAHETGNPVLGDPEHVEAAAEWPGEPGVFFEALMAEGWIDPLPDGQWEIHDYWHHAPDYVRRRAQAEERRRTKGTSLSDERRAAALARWGKPEKSAGGAMQTDATCMQTDANGVQTDATGKNSHTHTQHPVTPYPLEGDGKAAAQPAVPDFGLSAEGLSEAWCFFLTRKRLGATRDSPLDMDAEFRELLRLGHDAARLREAILDPRRDRGEHFWEFKKRLKQKAVPSPEEAEAELERKVLESRRRFADPPGDGPVTGKDLFPEEGADDGK